MTRIEQPAPSVDAPRIDRTSQTARRRAQLGICPVRRLLERSMPGERCLHLAGDPANLVEWLLPTLQHEVLLTHWRLPTALASNVQWLCGPLQHWQTAMDSRLDWCLAHRPISAAESEFVAHVGTANVLIRQSAVGSDHDSYWRRGGGFVQRLLDHAGERWVHWRRPASAEHAA